MSWLSRLGNVFRTSSLNERLDDELQFHLEQKTADLVASGMTPEAARAAALRQLGSPLHLRESSRDATVNAWLEGIWQDTVLAVRNMRRQPGFTAVAVVTLMIGLGANTAIFSVVNAVLLRPLKVADADRIVRFVAGTADRPLGETASRPIARVWLQQTGVFQDVSAHRLDLLNLTGTPDPEQVAVARVTRGFFSLFGAPLLAGRTFTPEEDVPLGARVAVLSHALWVRQFGGKPDILGTALSLGSEPYTIIGILGAGFDSEQFNQVPDVWVPLQFDPNSRDIGGEFFFVSARLTPDATMAMANAQLEVAAAEYNRTAPQGSQTNRRFAVQPVKEAIVGNVRPSLLLLEVAVSLVLLIACANVANLLLIRGTGRAREMAIRAAIGAGRARLVRQLITESMVLALAGAGAGMAFGMLGIRALLAMYPSANPTIIGASQVSIPRIGEYASSVNLDWRVLAFAIAVSMAACVFFGLFPAIQASRVDLLHALKQTVGGTRTGRNSRRGRGALVVAEIALALMLLIGAGLLIRTSLALRAVNPGFDSQNVLTMRMSVSGTPFERRDGIARLTRDGLQRMLAVPGVAAASTTCCMPLESVWQLPFVIQGRPQSGLFRGVAGWTFVSPGYFDVFSVPIVRGRDFDQRDDASGPGVVIINQEMARRFWPTGDPLNDSLIIGRDVRPDYAADPIRRVIGIVGNVRDTGLTRNPRPAMYVPVSQVPDGVTILNVRLLPIVWVARTTTAPYGVAPVIAKELEQASGGLPIARIRSMDQVVSESIARTRFDMLLMVAFAVSALVLAAVGVYGSMAYSVEQRTHEIGIRLALGAGPSRVRRMIVRQAMILAAVGVALGTLAAFSFARVLAGLLFGVSPRDPAIFVLVPLLLLTVALLAAWLPAVRATRITPMNALRYE